MTFALGISDGPKGSKGAAVFNGALGSDSTGFSQFTPSRTADVIEWVVRVFKGRPTSSGPLLRPRSTRERDNNPTLGDLKTLNLEEIPCDSYSANNVTAVADKDGMVTLNLAREREGLTNHLHIMDEWNYAFRVYRP